ncbi:MAG: cysteine desulfurase [Oligoflexia bacterium]|nr:cysteine desulfurase [Oligoflexia bacterium]
MSFDVNKLRSQFPILATSARGRPLVYLDNAATTQKPLRVIEACQNYYLKTNANVHRGVHYLSEKATQEYEDVRKKLTKFINASSHEEIIFVRGTTEAINLIASSFGSAFLKTGDEILITAMEHHSNIVPWQLACQKAGAKLVVAPITKRGEVDVAKFKELLSQKTRLVSFVHLSNALGTLNDAQTLTRWAKEIGALVHIDCAQSVSHLPVDVQNLGCDFISFSSHKMYGPTGVGVLWGRKDILNKLPPYQGGGDMIRTVTFEKTEYADLPHKFEAGTPNIEGVIGLGAAIDFLNEVDLKNIHEYESELLKTAIMKLSKVPGLRFIGEAESRASVISFVLEGVHPHDIGTIVDQQGVAIRTGHHCAQPVMDFFEVPATCRASLGLYNTASDIDSLVEALLTVRKVFRR